jgi:bloom syndrome protein
MDISLSPGRKTAAKKPVKPKKCKKKASIENHVQLSTNVSSPVRKKARRQVVRTHDSDESDGFEFAHRTTNGYAIDDFVVEDEEEEEYDPDETGYNQVKSTPSRKQSRAGNVKIKRETSDPMNQLSPQRRDVVENIMEYSRRQCRNLMFSKSLRTQPFSDTVLRDMAIRAPKTQQELLTVPGINQEMAKLYGKPFIDIIINSMEIYHVMKRANSPTPDGARSINNELGRSSKGLKPFDPNHQEVITIDDDNEDLPEAAGGLSDTEDDLGLEQSRYFTQKPPAEVAKYNSFFDQSQSRSYGASTGSTTTNQASSSSSSYRTTPAGTKAKQPVKKVDLGKFAMNGSSVKGRQGANKDGKNPGRGGIGMMPI